MTRHVFPPLVAMVAFGCSGGGVIGSGDYLCETDADCAWGWQCVPQGERSVCVTLPDELAITPAAADVGAGRFLQLTANAAVTWSIEEGTPGGEIDAGGGYLAPLEPGTFTVVATSVADPSRAARARIAVRPLELAVLAGQLGGAGNIDGVGADARFAGASGVAVDGAGYVWVASDDCTLRRIDPTTTEVVKLVGQSSNCHPWEGTGRDARVGNGSLAYGQATGKLYLDSLPTHGAAFLEIDPTTLVVRRLGDVSMSAYADFAVSDDGYIYYGYNNAIHRSALDGSAGRVVIAGAENEYGTVDGKGTAARFASARGVALDGRGNLIIATNTALRKLDLTTLDVTTVSAAVVNAWSVAVTSTGVIHALSPDGVLTSLNLDGSALHTFPASFAGCLSLTAEGADVYAGCGETIRRVTGRVVTPVAGLASAPGAVDGTATAARFSHPAAVAVRGGDAFVADTGNGLVRRIDLATGEVRTLLRTAEGVTEPVRFDEPSGIAVDGDMLYVSDAAASTIYRLFLEDGRTEVLVRGFYRPGQLAYDGAGHLYVGDDGNGRIRRVDLATGRFATVTETFGRIEYRDRLDGHAVKQVPYGFAIDRDCNLYVSSAWDGSIERVDPVGGERTLVTQVRPANPSRYRATWWSQPIGLASDRHGYLYYGSPGANGLFRVLTATGEVERVAGVDGEQGVRLGPLPARVSDPVALAVTDAGDLLVVDRAEHVVLIVRQGRTP